MLAVLLLFDGVSTIQQKAKSALEKNLAGIMIWEISQDTDDSSKGLLNALYQALGE